MDNLASSVPIEWSEYLTNNIEVFHSTDSSQIYRLRNLFRDVSDRGATVWLAGNGGSSSAASHAVADFVKTAPLMGQRKTKAFALHESTALFTAFSNDVGFEQALALSLRAQASSGDLLLSISVSGRSPNLLAAHTEAKKLGLGTATITGVNGLELAQSSDAGVVIPSDNYQIVENMQTLILHWLAITL